MQLSLTASRKTMPATPAIREIVLPYPEAAALVQQHARSLPLPGIEKINLADALDRCLATNILADRDQPPFNRSTRDGFAVRSADLQQHAALLLTGELRAGEPATSHTVHAGETIEIMTGAPMPQGADAVLMVEHILSRDSHAPAHIRLDPSRKLQPGENIVPAGSEARAGIVIIPAGTRLSPMHIGAAASCGIAQLEVYRQPRVAILATGDELVEVGEPILPYQIRNSNTYALASQVQRAGAIPVRLPITRDTKTALVDNLATAAQCDLILLSGGVSMGQYDLVEQVLETLHAEFLFTGVQIQPGKPAVFGRLPAQPYFFGLPGNPVSTMVTCALFASPFIRALAGENNPSPLFSQARLTTPFQHRPGLTRFLPALLATTWDSSEVTPIPWQGSGDLAATARANCFIVIPPDQPTLDQGSAVSVLLAYR